MASRSDSRTGVAAILAGVLIFAGHGGELVFGSSDDDNETVYAVLGTAGIVALAFALWGLRPLVSATKKGRVGIRLALAGVGLLVLFAVTAVISLARTGDAPNTFVLFLFGFLFILVGQLLFARDLRPTLGRGWLLPIAAVVGLVVALGAGDNPVHDVGLFAFEAAWVTLGVALLRAGRRRQPHTASALV
jgi:drug/metabolite transporter (DMT)-like permease